MVKLFYTKYVNCCELSRSKFLEEKKSSTVCKQVVNSEEYEKRMSKEILKLKGSLLFCFTINMLQQRPDQNNSLPNIVGLNDPGQYPLQNFDRVDSSSCHCIFCMKKQGFYN